MTADRIYKVVVNQEEQYSIWPAHRKNPYGWNDADKIGEKDECLAYINSVWTGMRPLSLRKQMENSAQELHLSKSDNSNHKCVHHLFEQQAMRTPEATAIIFAGQQMTYGELNHKANQLARHLQSRGVMPEIKIGLCIERSIEMVVGLLGILKSGGVYVPLDPLYPQNRLQLVIQNARIQTLLTQEHLQKRNTEDIADIILIDKDWSSISRQRNENVANGPSATNLSHVIFTSGSTGTPKGAMVAHASLCDNVQSLSASLKISAEDVYLHTASIAFTSSLRQLLVPLSVGASIVIATAEQRTNPMALIDLVKKNDVTILDTVASFWESFTHTLTDLDAERRNFFLNNRLRMILSSGGELPSRIPKRWRSQFKHVARLINMYGQTETVGNILVFPIPEADDLHTEIVPLGPPLNNYKVYLLDEQLNLAAAGVAAELYIGGPNIARGYSNQPELTAEKFIPDPFSNIPGARLYRSGDLGRRLSDAIIEFVGRIDFQINIRGFRIEPGEIESMIKMDKSVAETVVIARDDPGGDKRLIAYVVASSKAEITIKKLRERLEANLPDYMIPAVFVMLGSLPKLPNGKIDRRSLPAPDQKRPNLGRAYVPPRNELQRYLANLWCNILRLDKVGIHDLFFELGGTSLLAARFVNRLQVELGEFIYIVSLFEAPTIAQYADFLKNHYAHAIATKFPHMPDVEGGHPIDQEVADSERKLNESTLRQMRQFIPSFRQSKADEIGQNEKNPTALFILAPPRAGTALLRIMLAGHPELFLGNELQLLGFHTLKERKATLFGRYDEWLKGIVRVIMAIMRCDINEARQLLQNYETNGSRTKEFYKILQERLGKRILVDASSTYALDFETLRQAENVFEDAHYIHFASHPSSMIRSFQSSRMAERLYLYEHPFNSRNLGELLWVICHQNILEFLDPVPGNRKYQMRLEDLMVRPQETLTELCQVFNLEFHPDMLRPIEQNDSNRLKASDGVLLSERAGKFATPHHLSDITWKLAEKFGYQRIAPHRQNSAIGNPIQVPYRLSTRKEFVEKQRQRRLANRAHKYREGKLNDR